MKGSSATNSPHRFENSRAVEAKWESILDQAVRESYPLSTVERVSLAEEFLGVDRHVIDDAGETTTLEYKVDERWQQTGNAFFEILSNSRTGRPGWMVTCTATWLLYFLTPGRVLVFEMAALRQARPRWEDQFPTRTAVNDGYDTVGLCVPITVAEAAAESISWLSRGDAIILQRRDDR